jgi:hypothetical protein
VESDGDRDGTSGVRVIVVDDHPLFREGLRAALESTDDVRVVAEAETAAAARPELCAQLAVVVDLAVEDDLDASGVALVRLLAAGRVGDRKPVAAQRPSGAVPGPGLVGPAVPLDRPGRAPVVRGEFGVEVAVDSAHDRSCLLLGVVRCLHVHRPAVPPA